MNVATPHPLRADTLNIILVEDDDGDAKAVMRALKDSRIANPVHRLRDGIEALAFLRGEGKVPPPQHYVVLLDINMPRMNGHEFMERLRASPDPLISNAVVFVLSTSAAERDIKDAYAKNVAGYLVKSDYTDGLKPVVSMIKIFGDAVRLP